MELNGVIIGLLLLSERGPHGLNKARGATLLTLTQIAEVIYFT